MISLRTKLYYTSTTRMPFDIAENKLREAAGKPTKLKDFSKDIAQTTRKVQQYVRKLELEALIAAPKR